MVHVIVVVTIHYHSSLYTVVSHYVLLSYSTTRALYGAISNSIQRLVLFIISSRDVLKPKRLSIDFQHVLLYLARTGSIILPKYARVQHSVIEEDSRSKRFVRSSTCISLLSALNRLLSPHVKTSTA